MGMFVFWSSRRGVSSREAVMSKFTKILFTLFLLVFVAAGSVVPDQAMATYDGDLQLFPEDSEQCGDLIMEQNGGANDGASGDPDSLGGGYGFMGGTFGAYISDLIEAGIITIEDYVCILMEQWIFAP